MSEGWAAIPNWLVRHSEVTPNMTAVYAVIQSHAGSKGTARLLLQTIADEAGMSYSSAQRAAKALNALGVLWWEAQGAVKKRTASIYHPLQEADPSRVEQAHKPASRREPVRSGGTVTGTVLTQVNPQDSAVPGEPVRSEMEANTVTAVRSQGPYVRSQGPREEEPSKKNPSSLASKEWGPWRDVPDWRPIFIPSDRAVAKVFRLYPELTAEDQMHLADKVGADVVRRQDERGPSDRLFEVYCENEAKRRREEAEEAERIAKMDVGTYFGWDQEAAQRRWNEQRGITE